MYITSLKKTITWGLLLAFLSCSGPGEGTAELSKKPDITIAQNQKNLSDPITSVKKIIKGRYPEHSDFQFYTWEEVEVWNAPSFKYVVRCREIRNHDTSSFTFVLDSLSKINCTIFTDKKEEFFKSFNEDGVQINWYSSLNMEYLGMEYDIELLHINEEGIFSIAAPLPDSLPYENDSFSNFINKTIPGITPTELSKVSRVLWGDQIIDGNELEFDVVNGLITNIHTQIYSDSEN